ncbi:MAG: substrate-binding domain-containing protein, partial [Armatimonadetes bacterium]|nr:substrate-binding domain-containing protein [Anaerolineae bacterium]
MRHFQRRTGMCILFFALLIAPVYGISQAQATPGITVGGSGIAAQAFQALADASGANAVLTVTVNGTNAGLNDFCNGVTDVALATRPMNTAEEAQCKTAAVVFNEVLLGYDATVFVASAENAYLECIAPSDLNTLFAPSAAGQTDSWSQFNPEYPAEAITLVLPPANTTPFAKIDSLAAGDGVRGDAVSAADDAAVLAAVAADANAIGVVRFSALTDESGVRALSYSNGTLSRCVAPAAETLADRTYELADRLFAYVNTARLDKAGLRDLLTYAASDAAAAAVITAGFTA